MSSIQLSVMFDVDNSLSLHPSCVAKTLMLDIVHKLFNQFFHTCHSCRHYGPPKFYLTFSDLKLIFNLGLGVVRLS